MKNKVIWIHGEGPRIDALVDNMISPLWSNGVRSEMLLINRFLSADKINDMMCDKFVSFLIDEGVINDEDAFKRYWPLVDHDCSNHRLSDTVREENELFGDRKRMWEGISTTCLDHIPDACGLVDVVHDRFGDLEDDTMVMIDMCLLPDDFRKLMLFDTMGHSAPVISMGLYNAFVKSLPNVQIGIYTSYFVPDALSKGWADAYAALCGSSDGICIYNIYGRPVLEGTNTACDFFSKVNE